MQNVTNVLEMDYTEFINYLKSKKILYIEQQFDDLEMYFTTYTLVSPVNSDEDVRAFDNDGGYQLSFS